MSAELSVNDHLEGILSDFEALKRSFDVEDVDDLPAFSPSSPLSSPFSPTSPGMVIKSNGESRRSPGSHLPMYQSHISISSSPGHSPALKNRIGSSLSFNRGTIQMARSNGSAHASLTRVSSFQTRLQPNGFSSSGPGSDSESLHSSTSSLEWQPASKLVTPMRPTQLPVGMYEPSVRIARISSPVLKKFSSSHGSVFHSEVERSIVRPVPQEAVNHSSFPSLDLHIAEDQGSDLIPSPNTAYPSSAGWSSPSLNRTPLLAKHPKPVSREPSFSSSSSSSSPPPYGCGRPDGATPPPFIRPAQPSKLQKFPISLDSWLGRPTDCQNLVSEVHVVPKSLPRTQMKVSPHTNSGPLNPMSTVRENTVGTLRGLSATATPERFSGDPSPGEILTTSMSPPEERRFHPAPPPQVVQTPSMAMHAGLAPLQQETAPVQPVPRENLQSMMERARSFSRADRALPAAITCPQETHSGPWMSVPSEEPVKKELRMESKAQEDAQLVSYLQRQEEWKTQNGQDACSEPNMRAKVAASSITEIYTDSAWTDMENDQQPAAEEEDGEKRGPQPAGMGREPFGYVGIESVLDQMRRKAMKNGFEFNIMVVGQSGLGKSTLVNTLFKSKISRKSTNANHDERIPKTVELKSISHVIEEKGLKMKLTVIDTPGFGDQINNQHCWEPIVKYIQEQYEKYLREEIVINRKRRIPDTRIHCCIYFVPPTGHWLRPLDVEFMKRLGKVVNVVPVIAKADTLTLEEREDFKQQIRKDLQAHGISVYPQRELDEDTEETFLNDKIREKIPFAVVGTDQEHQVNGKTVLGRKTKWGIIEVENETHCEFANLRDLLIRSNLQDLKDITQNIHYESFRMQRLTERNLQAQSSDRGLHGCPLGKESNF